MDKLTREEQYSIKKSLESISKSLSILSEDTKERKIALQKNVELISGLEESIQNVKEDPLGLNNWSK